MCCERPAWQSLIAAVVRRFSGTQSHLGGWQWRGEEERIPHSPPLLVCWNAAALQVRGENKEAAVRIETGHVPPDEVRTVGVGGDGGELRPYKTCVTAGLWGGKVTSTPLDLQRGCIRDAAVNIQLHPRFVFNIHKCEQSTAQRSCNRARRCQNTPVTA